MGRLLAALAIVFAVGGGIIGWVLNIIQLFTLAAAGTINGMFILKAIGIFVAPLGAVLGWIG